MKNKFPLLFTIALTLSSCGLFSSFINGDDNLDGVTPTRLTLSAESIDIPAGSNKKITYSFDKTPKDLEKNFKITSTATWMDAYASSDSEITITVLSTAKNGSLGRITASYKTLKATCDINVVESIPAADRINLSSSNVYLKKGMSTTISAEPNGELPSGYSYTYEVSKTWLGVNQNSNQFTLTVGEAANVDDTATITISYASLSASATVTVLADDDDELEKYGDIVNKDYHLQYADRLRTNIEEDSGEVDPSDPLQEKDDLSSIEIDVYNSVGSYAENYGTQYYGGKEFGLRKVNHNPSLTLIAKNSREVVYGYGGSIFNDQYSPLRNISYIDVTYQGSSELRLFYGDTFGLLNTYISLEGEGKNEISLPTKPEYFRLEATTGNITITELVIYYEGGSASSTSPSFRSGDDLVRFNAPTKTSFEEGETVIMPIDYDEASGKVLKSKIYTYYSFDYVKEHTELVEETTWTDPVDVMNYVQAFKEWPNNYSYSSDKSVVSSYYGSSNVRQVSRYNRTDGYVNSVPYVYGSYYYELDVDLNGNYGGNRGVGRIVWFADGFNYSDGVGVCVYTDDHYYSFIEYYNNGSFSYRFDASESWCGISHSKPSSISFF